MPHFGTRDVSCFLLAVSCSINFPFQVLAHWAFIIQIDSGQISVDREEKQRKQTKIEKKSHGKARCPREVLWQDESWLITADSVGKFFLLLITEPLHVLAMSMQQIGSGSELIDQLLLFTPIKESKKNSYSSHSFSARSSSCFGQIIHHIWMTCIGNLKVKLF